MYLWGNYYILSFPPVCLSRRNQRQPLLLCTVEPDIFRSVGSYTCWDFACLFPVSLMVLHYGVVCGGEELPLRACTCCMQVTSLPPSRGTSAPEWPWGLAILMENELLSSTSALLSTLRYCLLPPLFPNGVTCCLELICKPTTEAETQLCLFNIKTSLPVGHSYLHVFLHTWCMQVATSKSAVCIHMLG